MRGICCACYILLSITFIICSPTQQNNEDIMLVPQTSFRSMDGLPLSSWAGKVYMRNDIPRYQIGIESESVPIGNSGESSLNGVNSKESVRAFLKYLLANSPPGGNTIVAADCCPNLVHKRDFNSRIPSPKREPQVPRLNIYRSHFDEIDKIPSSFNLFNQIV